NGCQRVLQQARWFMMVKLAFDRGVFLFFVVLIGTCLLPERCSNRTIADHDYLRIHALDDGPLVRIGVFLQQTNLAQDIYSRCSAGILKITAINRVAVIGYKSRGRTDVSKSRA